MPWLEVDAFPSLVVRASWLRVWLCYRARYPCVVVHMLKTVTDPMLQNMKEVYANGVQNEYYNLNPSLVSLGPEV